MHPRIELSLAFVLVLSSHCTAAGSSNISSLTGLTTPLDPFRDFRLHATPKYSEPICCLTPPSSDAFAVTAEFESFEEWKSKQFALQSQSQNLTPISDTSRTDNGSQPSPSPIPPNLGDSDTQSTPLSDTASVFPFHVRVPLTDRFNYASLECSARVHASHREARSPSSILSSKKDKYMLSPCSVQSNFVIVELCDDIRIDTVQLANFEFFSGVFKDFKVSVAQTYPPDMKGWTEMGTYRAKNVRSVQSFHPLVELRPFYRYIRLELLSHYGNEFYCPVSLLRVYGLTQMEEWKWEMWQLPEETSSIFEDVALTTSKDNRHESIPTTNDTTPGNYLSSTPITGLPTLTIDATASSTELQVASTANLEGPLVSRSKTSSMRPMEEVTPPAMSISTGMTTPTTTNIVPTNTLQTDFPRHSQSIESVFMNTTINYTLGNASIIPSSSIISPSPTLQTIFPIPSPLPVASGESIYRLIMNRLIMLESNTTLYQKYVQDQTMRIHEALRKLEEDVGRLEGISKSQQVIFLKSLQELDRRKRQLEDERLELLDKVNQMANEIMLEKRLGIAQLCLLLTVLIFMALTRGTRADTASFFDGAMHRISNFSRRSPWSSMDWTDHSRNPSSPTTTSAYFPQNPVMTTVSRSVPISSLYDHADEVSLPRPTTPKSPRRRSYVHRSQHTPRTTSPSRPIGRLRRSNSHTATPTVSTKRLARTAHLHEVQSLPPKSKWHQSSDEDPAPSKNKINTAGQLNSDVPNKQENNETTDSWIDTEPGSDVGLDESAFDNMDHRRPRMHLDFESGHDSLDF